MLCFSPYKGVYLSAFVVIEQLAVLKKGVLHWLLKLLNKTELGLLHVKSNP